MLPQRFPLSCNSRTFCHHPCRRSVDPCLLLCRCSFLIPRVLSVQILTPWHHHRLCTSRSEPFLSFHLPRPASLHTASASESRCANSSLDPSRSHFTTIPTSTGRWCQTLSTCSWWSGLWTKQLSVASTTSSHDGVVPLSRQLIRHSGNSFLTPHTFARL